MSEDKLVNNMVTDTLHDMILDRDRTIGQFKAAIRAYFYYKEIFDRDQDYASYSEMKETEKKLKKLGDLWHEPRSPA